MNLILPIYSFFIITLLLMLFFLKENIYNEETKIYKYLLIISFFNIVFNICGIYIGYTVGETDFLYVLNHFDLPLYFWWSSLLFVYILYIYLKSNVEMYNKIYKGVLCVNFICTFITLFLPFQVIIEEQAGYAIGLCVNFIYVLASIYLVLCLILSIFLVVKKTNIKKTIPIFSLLFFGLLSSIFQKIEPSLIIVPAVAVYIELIMYFTIENPDIKMINQLEIAREQAEKASNAKTDFLSSMSHEIRTPLNAIVGFSEEITRANNLEEAKENSKDIIEASHTLLDIVNGILDISKIESGKLEIINSPYDARDVFESLGKLIRPRIEEKGIEFKVSIADDLPPVLYGDYANVKKVVTNLLTNAAKYTDKGEINYSVNCVINNNICRLIIAIEDTGRGIKKESINKLFTKFERLEEKNTTIEGTGLGLAITKQIVELMGGEIVVQSVYGSGSKFTVALNQSIEKVDLKSIKKKDDKIDIDLSGKRILVVDDNKLNLKVASKVLEKYHPVLELLDSGLAVIEKIKNKEYYDLILMDDMMPKLSGVETLKILKKIDGFNIPTIALTANAISGMREKYISEGFDDYLSKPINKVELEAVLKNILNNNYDVDNDRFEPLPDELYEMDKTLTDIKIDYDKLNHGESMIEEHDKIVDLENAKDSTLENKENVESVKNSV